MKLLANNFYALHDPKLSILQVLINSEIVWDATDTDSRHNDDASLISFFIPEDAADRGDDEARLTLLTRSDKRMEYSITRDANDEQRLFRLAISGTDGLVSSVDVRVTVEMDADYSTEPAAHERQHAQAEPLPLRPIAPASSTSSSFSSTSSSFSGAYVDSDFWFYQKEFNVLMPGDNEIVESIEVSSTSHELRHALRVSALQGASGTLTLLVHASVDIRVSQVHRVDFVIATNTTVYTTTPLTITPRDPSLSECIVTGTLFEGEVSTQSQLEDITCTVCFTLRSETWLADVDVLRPLVLGMIHSEPYHACDASWFANDRDAPVNPVGLGSVIQEANVTLLGSQSVLVTFGRRLVLVHPERVTLTSPPLAALHAPAAIGGYSADAADATGTVPSGIPLVVPFSNKTIVPSPGRLRVIANGGQQNVRVDDFWEGVRITLAVERDAWQDLQMLTDEGQESMRLHAKRGLTSTSAAWNEMLEAAQVDVTTDGESLHIDIFKQSPNTFNVRELVEVHASMPVMTQEGLVARTSGQEAATERGTDQPARFVVLPLQGRVAIRTTVSISESDMWTRAIRIPLELTDDAFLEGAELELQTHARTTFSAHFPRSTLSALVRVERVSSQRMDILVPQGTPSSFNIPHLITVALTVPSSALRNGTELAIPVLTFTPTQVVAWLEDADGLTKQAVQRGCTFRVCLTNDTWRPFLSTAIGNTSLPVNIVSRQTTSRGWNAVVREHLRFSVHESGTELSVTVPPGLPYDLSLCEVIDVFVLENATYNGKFMHVSYFTVQGSTRTEQFLYAYLSKLDALLQHTHVVKKALNQTRLNVKPAGSLVTQDDAQDARGLPSNDFTASDTLYTRLRKLNTVDASQPASICKPPLLNSVSSRQALEFTSMCIDALSEFHRGPVLSTHPFLVCVPTLIPPIRSSQPRQLHTVLLSRPSTMTMSVYPSADGDVDTDAHDHLHQPGAVYTSTGAAAYVLALSAHDTLVVHGPYVQHTTFTPTAG